MKKTLKHHRHGLSRSLRPRSGTCTRPSGASPGPSRRPCLLIGSFFALLLAFSSISRVSAEETPSNAGTSDVRVERRAFYTAPPVVPHALAPGDEGSCLGCHQDVVTMGDRVSPKTPHPELSSCVQCHAYGRAWLGGGNTEVNNSWEGLEEPRQGTRQHAQAPPTIPHRLFMRENCNSCHAKDNPNPRLRGPHPERSSCLQCHALEKARLF